MEKRVRCGQIATNSWEILKPLEMNSERPSLTYTEHLLSSVTTFKSQARDQYSRVGNHLKDNLSLQSKGL